jgi:hypothetical protein
MHTFLIFVIAAIAAGPCFAQHPWQRNANAVATLMTAPGGPASASTRPPRPDELDGNEWPMMERCSRPFLAQLLHF